ncbi:cation:proton antiporter [Anaerotalea alkaliphila]|uniref:Cation:proton antiporter n=1 Tax=Anaerotalea alkaliphila TaxID=2662126 RepID=A0A7X5HY40_9FIRM|nr:cation:proton antiporter [Anaerotalea alkaliphila]NDL68788.1 cation:proton antiporter [Anaerotalea alkaliphila]
MLSYGFFLDLAIILLSTKLFGLLTRKFQMPQVVGALLAGLILGPTFLNILEETTFINQMAELGVIMLMFAAGMETDIHELKKTGKASFVIAIFGVAIPLIGGFLATAVFSDSLGNMTQAELLQNIFIGIILTATSVSITVETLREMGKLKSPAGTAILGAAVIDDILGIIILTIVISFKDTSVNIGSILFRIALFFVFAIVSGFVLNKAFDYMSRRYGRKRRIPIYGFVLCLLMSYIAEHYFGIADITGAYLAGIVISNLGMNYYVAEKVEVTSYMLLSPIFFASIGIKTALDSLDSRILIFSLVLLLVAVFSKVLGCGFGARIMGYKKQEALRIGVGMVSRGEVALIVADKGASVGLVSNELFAPVIIVVIVTTLITPILLKIVFAGPKEDSLQAT